MTVFEVLDEGRIAFSVVRVEDFGFRVSDFGFRFSGPGFGFRVSDFGFRVSGFGLWVSGSVVRVDGFRVLSHSDRSHRLSDFTSKIDGFRREFNFGDVNNAPVVTETGLGWVSRPQDATLRKVSEPK